MQNLKIFWAGVLFLGLNNDPDYKDTPSDHIKEIIEAMVIYPINEKLCLVDYHGTSFLYEASGLILVQCKKIPTFSLGG